MVCYPGDTTPRWQIDRCFHYTTAYAANTKYYQCEIKKYIAPVAVFSDFFSCFLFLLKKKS